MTNKITFYTSQFCSHSWTVERFLTQNEINVDAINIDDNPEARAKLIEITGGYASVPTLIFPDGTRLTEPSMGQLRSKLGIEQAGLMKKMRGLFSGNSKSAEK